MKNILVTGGAGYIGSVLVKFLVNKKLNVCVVDNLSNGKRFLVNKKAKFYKCDILNKTKIKNILLRNKIDTIVHLASLINVQDSLKKPKKYFRNNFIGTKNLLSAVENSLVEKIIFSSSCAVYKEKRNTKAKLNEKSIINPTSVYGKLKFKTEKLIKAFCKKKKLKYIILRYFNVVGANNDQKPYLGQTNNLGQLFQNVSLHLLDKINVFKIYGNNYSTKDGTCIRDFIHVKDLAEIQYLSIKYIDRKNKDEVFNCGYGKGYTVKEVIKNFEKVAKKKTILKIMPRRKGDVVSAICDNKKILNYLNWKPRYSNLNIMVRDTFKWFKYYKK